MSNITRITEWIQVSGKWTRMSKMNNYLSNDIIPEIRFLMIPGNPGNERFYEHFGQKILELIDRNVEFLTISHLNHVELPDRLKNSSELRRNDRFLLEDQVKHKFDFVEEYLPKDDAKLIIMGHSIGAYMGLSILDNIVNAGYNVTKFLALFPTIEKMAVSPNGIRLGGLLDFFDNHQTLQSIIVSWLWLLPDPIKKILVGFNLKDNSTPECVVESAIELLSAPVINNIIHMSNDELKTVVDHNPDLLKQKDKILIYYGQNDHWVPNYCPKQQLERLGDEHVIIDSDNCEHAFVIRNGETMAKNIISLLGKYIK